jgi:hypothetical protein
MIADAYTNELGKRGAENLAPAEADEPDTCSVIIEGDWDNGHWTPVLCGKPATDGDDRCAEHAA